MFAFVTNDLVVLRVVVVVLLVVVGGVVVVVVVVAVVRRALELVAILLVDGRPAFGCVEVFAAPAGKLVKLSRLSACQN